MFAQVCLVFPVKSYLEISVNLAQLEGKTEYCLEDQCKETKSMTMRAVALVDLKQQRTYGIKVEVYTVQ